jgi:hypothetical protein
MVFSIRKAVLFSTIIFSQSAFAFATNPQFKDGRVSFDVELNAAKSRYNVRTVLVMPGQPVQIASSVPLTIASLSQRLAEDKKEYRWVAPSLPGSYQLALHHEPSKEKISVQVFVLTPREQVKGYAIGNYPDKGGKYQRPRGFIKVTRQDENIQVSPHFHLKQFLCKQAGGYPKYVLVDERLLSKLEQILERINERGYRTDSLHVMSGFRTPAYNRSLGNVSLSRHLFGDAADIFVAGHDGSMADINNDGKRNLGDAQYLRSLILELEAEGRSDFAPGGVGHYKSTHAHGPYVHVDARGETARWAGAGISSIKVN